MGRVKKNNKRNLQIQTIKRKKNGLENKQEQKQDTQRNRQEEKEKRSAEKGQKRKKRNTLIDKENRQLQATIIKRNKQKQTTIETKTKKTGCCLYVLYIIGKCKLKSLKLTETEQKREIKVFGIETKRSEGSNERWSCVCNFEYKVIRRVCAFFAAKFFDGLLLPTQQLLVQCSFS